MSKHQSFGSESTEYMTLDITNSLPWYMDSTVQDSIVATLMISSVISVVVFAFVYVRKGKLSKRGTLFIAGIWTLLGLSILSLALVTAPSPLNRSNFEQLEDGRYVHVVSAEDLIKPSATEYSDDSEKYYVKGDTAIYSDTCKISYHVTENGEGDTAIPAVSCIASEIIDGEPNDEYTMVSY